MGTTFGVRLKNNEIVEIARTYSSNSKINVVWLNRLATMLSKNTPLIAINNGNGNIETLADLLKLM